MDKLSKLATAIVAACLTSATGLALTITPATTPQWTGTNNSNLNATALEAFLLTQGVVVDLTDLLYKKNVGESGDTGTFASSYDTTFQNTSTDPEDALVDYVSGPAIAANSELFLYVKDGNHNPAFYLFKITNWNGTEDLVLNDFWPAGGAISNIALYATASTKVPDGGLTALMLGLGLAGVGWLRGRRYADPKQTDTESSSRESR